MLYLVTRYRKVYERALVEADDDVSAFEKADDDDSLQWEFYDGETETINAEEYKQGLPKEK